MSRFEGEVEVVADGTTYTCWGELHSKVDTFPVRSFGGKGVALEEGSDLGQGSY